MVDYVACVLLTLSIITSFISVMIRVLQWHDTMESTNVPARLVTCLAFSDLIASTVWLLTGLIPAGWPGTCPTLMIFVYFSLLSACFYTNCMGVHLVALINRRNIRERYYYISSWGIPIVLILIWVNMDTYAPWHGGRCWFTYTYDVLFWRTLQIVSFFLNAILFGFITYKIFWSRHSYMNNNGMKDKERRLYLLIICFFVPTCGGVLNLVYGHEKIQKFGLYMINSQGFLNAFAMNEKILQNYISSICKKQSFLLQSTTNSEPTSSLPSNHSCA
eukprot:Phypoly_transcript_13727.p1 GENE.Phypoly_transcript_13727~~Phypoly_transcript_13727.p1  ORF type:complete len:275 (+),score=-0.94 Phypoly_transcript_13727:158-982(+)